VFHIKQNILKGRCAVRWSPDLVPTKLSEYNKPKNYNPKKVVVFYVYINKVIDIIMLDLK